MLCNNVLGVNHLRRNEVAEVKEKSALILKAISSHKKTNNTT